VAIVIGPLLGHLVGVARGIRVVDQDQVALPLLLMVEELPPVSKTIEEFPVAVDVRVEMAKLTEESTLGLGIAGVKFPHLVIQQIVEEKGAILSPLARRELGIKSTPPLCFLTGHKVPTDLLHIGKDPGLDGFVFGG
jgi:hypothetical protein